MARNLTGMTDEELRKLASDNSDAWYGADGDEQRRLHNENTDIKRLLDERTNTSSSFDPASGKWTTTGSASYGGAGTKGYDDNPNFDYSRYIGELMDSGSQDADYLQRLLSERGTKAVNSGMTQYANDDFARKAQGYIDDLRRGQIVNADAPTYTSPYADQIRSAAEALLNRNPFTFDPETSPMYASYKKQYAREGQRAAADTMGQYAAMTGGMPSTAAVAASQQAGDYYAAQMADVIPELYKLAYSMYQDEGDRQRADLTTLMQLEQNNRDQYLTELGQFNTDRAFRYNMQRDKTADARYADETEYARSQDELARALQLAQLGGEYGDYSKLKELGITPDLSALTALTTAGSASLLRQSTGGGSGGGGSGSGGSNGGNTETTESPASEAGMNETAFNQEARVIMAYLGQGMDEKATDRINLIWGKLSTPQKNQLMTVLNKHGIDIEED